MVDEVFAYSPSEEAGRSVRPAGREGEARSWASLPGGWRVLFGGHGALGVSLEWHHFRSADAVEWSKSFHPDSLELCLNLTGCGMVCSGRRRMEFGPMTAGFYGCGRGSLQAWRSAEQDHQFLTLEMSPGFLRRELAGCDGALHPLVERFSTGAPAGLGEVHRLTLEQERLVRQLPEPPTFQGARSLWYRSKILELMADFLFERRGPEELFCDRQKRLARERVDRVRALLRERLAEPPSLEELGREVGCSPFYLSRTFSREAGMTIPQYLRQVRMERAAALLQGGRYNVTEAALEVGYSSLSHFSQAFCQVMGCCPALYPPNPHSSPPLA